MSIAEVIGSLVVAVVAGAAGVVVLLRPGWVWSLGRRLSICKGERPGPTYRSTSWIAGAVLVAIAVINVVTTAIQLMI